MAQPPIGLQEAIGLGIETTYGTGVSPGVWFRPISNSLKRAWVPLPMAGVAGSSAAIVYGAIPRAIRAAPIIAGQLVFEAEYDDLVWVLRGIYGAVVDSGAGTPWTHTFEVAEGAPAPTTPSFTFARVNGMEDLEYTGCKLAGLTLAGTPGSVVTVTLDVVGQDGGDVEAADDPATEGFSAAPYLEFQHSNLLYAAAVSTPLTVATHAQGSAASSPVGDKAPYDWSFSTQHVLRILEEPGTGLIREPVRAGFSTTTLTFNRDWADDEFLDKMANADIANAFGSFGVNVTKDSNSICDIQIGHGLLMGDQNTEFSGGGDVIPEAITVQAADPIPTAEPVVSVAITNTTETYPDADSRA